MEKVSIGVCTYKRDHLLLNLLNMIINQKINKDYFYDIIIVDNYRESSLKSKLMDIETNVQVNYFIEGCRGISSARNRCLDEAIKLGSKYIVFIDDDELVDESWLEYLVTTAEKFNADIVKGPVVTQYNSSIKEWIKKTKFYDRNENYETGTKINDCASGNTLVNLEVVETKGYRFDLKYGLSGGEDTKFFKEMIQDNCNAVFCKEAIAYEPLNESRNNVKYMLKKVITTSISFIKIEKEFNTSLGFLIKRFCLAIIHIFTGILLLPISFFSGKRGLFKSLQECCKGMGQIMGILNVSINNY